MTWGFTAGQTCKDGVRQISAGIRSTEGDNGIEVRGRGGVGFDTVSVNHGIASPHGPPKCAASVPSVLPTACICPATSHLGDTRMRVIFLLGPFEYRSLYERLRHAKKLVLSIHRPDSFSQTF